MQPRPRGHLPDAALGLRWRPENDELSEQHCEFTCPNLWDSNGEVEGIGGQYPDGTRFTYLSDESVLAERISARAAEELAKE